MIEVKRKEWRMEPLTRVIVSEAYKLCKEMNESYGQKVAVRQIYYYLFSNGIVQLTQRDYGKVCRFMTEARKRGYIPFECIEDKSRNPLWAMLYENIQHFLNLMLGRYKRNTWKNQENFVIILVEKEALAAIIWDIAREYNVSVFPTKGFSSWSMSVGDIKELAEYFGQGKKLIVLVLSDLDPSGRYIKEDYENKFRFMTEELGFKKPNIIEKIAITENQIQEYALPPRKKNYRNKGVLDIWELDALNPKVLREIVREAIEKYLDMEQLHIDLKEEKQEMRILQNMLESLIDSDNTDDSNEEDR